MSLEKAEQRIKAKADELRKSMHNASCVCVPPNVAEAILREFYGLPAAGGKTEATHGTPAQVADPGLISLEDFLWWIRSISGDDFRKHRLRNF